MKQALECMKLKKYAQAEAMFIQEYVSCTDNLKKHDLLYYLTRCLMFQNKLQEAMDYHVGDINEPLEGCRQTLLEMACHLNLPSIVKQLLEMGANPFQLIPNRGDSVFTNLLSIYTPNYEMAVIILAHCTGQDILGSACSTAIFYYLQKISLDEFKINIFRNEKEVQHFNECVLEFLEMHLQDLRFSLDWSDLYSGKIRDFEEKRHKLEMDDLERRKLEEFEQHQENLAQIAVIEYFKG